MYVKEIRSKFHTLKIFLDKISYSKISWNLDTNFWHYFPNFLLNCINIRKFPEICTQIFWHCFPNFLLNYINIRKFPEAWTQSLALLPEFPFKLHKYSKIFWNLDTNFWYCFLNFLLYYINKPTRRTFCMYLFYNFCTNLHVSNDHFVLLYSAAQYKPCKALFVLSCRIQ